MASDILVGLVGAGIQASRSPSLHTREAARLGLRYFYRLFDTDETTAALPDILRHAEELGYAGLNITHPYKQQVIQYLDEVRDEAAVLGAVNTVVFREGKRLGYNTDWWGFAENLRLGLPGVRLETVTLLGAGGAGSAVAYALGHARVSQLLIYDPDQDRTVDLIDRLLRHFPETTLQPVSRLPGALSVSNGLVNASPIGMEGHAGTPVPVDFLRPELWVADVVYFPLETQLLHDARSRGCRTLDGGGMVVYQAAKCFELFSGVKPDADRMRADFLSM
ncbi:MAG: shikimate dehydrogenase [Dehalococcoidia bacterium]